MQNVKSITLRNFKYFYGHEDQYPQNKLELDGNNLLLYGENGSGKSSIYWSLYTFLQSCLKEERSDIEKYFDHAHDENLRNRFAANSAASGIIIEFEDSNTGRVVQEQIASWNISTFQSTQLKQSLVSSDFINYKYLSKLYDFRNSEGINLFKLFERDIFMFIDFEEAFTKHDGSLSESTYASDWWKFISEEWKNLPTNASNRKFAERSDEYIRFKDETIPKFIRLLKRFLEEITRVANDFLEKEFKEAFTIEFDLEEIKCSFNKRVEGRTREKDGKLHKPTIPLKVNFSHAHFDGGSETIQKPHTTLNEARLTAIALAIRFAILDRRPVFPNSARLLILDDLLLSLDMSHRDQVLDIILSPTFIDTYQLLIFTHDRAFFNMCRNRINERFKSGWVFREMYQDENDAGIPVPFVPDNQNYLDRAKKYLKTFDYPACANYLRKETERLLTSILPQNLTLHLKEDEEEGTKPLKLDNMITNFRKYYLELGGDFIPFEKLKEHKDLLMNPLSHDNIDTPIYKRELLSSIELIEKLKQLVVVIIPTVSNNNNPLILKETDTAGDEWDYTFYLRENLKLIKSLNGNWLINNPKCLFSIRKNTTQNLAYENINAEGKLSSLYGNIRWRLGTKTNETDNAKDLKDIIHVDGQRLIDKINADANA
ncbi:MAG: hypothetical protein CL868_05235 [Cytophagaceae bacterium]|nr:hypothetical protein [Cytophagaceae bacterium]|tara:strand:- start:15623 stop:17593 length:1971 start_codon:yes stop_codon:yes gene_type:complete